MAASDTAGFQRKWQRQVWDNSLSVVSQGCPGNPSPKQYKLFPLLLIAHHKLMLRHGMAAEDAAHFGHRAWRNQVGTNQKASSLVASFHR